MFNSWKSLFNRGTTGSKGSPRAGQSKKKSRRASLSVEALEDRYVPSTLTVSSTSDLLNTPGTLRDAVNQANLDGAQGIGDTIEFQTGMEATHILLQQGHLELTKGAKVSIWGTGSFGVKMVLNGDGGNIFKVDSGAWLDLHELTLAGGTANAFTDPNGGAINNDGTLTLSLCSFVNNTATGSGGAIYNTGTVSVPYASTFTGNSAQGVGGAIFNATGGTASLLGAFSGNSAQSGGAVYNLGSVTVAASTFSGNTAQDVGGALFNQGFMTVSTSALTGNTAQNSGGAILNAFHGMMTVSSSTLANNSAPSDGAINNNGALTLSAATVVANTAVDGAGGIATVSSLTLVDTIVAGNTLTGANTAGRDVNGNVDVSSHHNLIGIGDASLTGISNGINNNQIGSSAAPIDPMLFPLGNYGGPTQIMPLQPGSKALAAGSSVTTLTKDLGNQATDTLISVADAAAIASTFAYNGTIQIDGETMLVTGVDPANNTLTVVRASAPQQPASHKAGAGVFFANDQAFYPVVPSAVAIGAAQSTTGPANKFSVTGPTAAGEISGVGFTVTITAQDVNGHTATQYNGPVTLKSSDGNTFAVQVINGVGTTFIGVDKAATGATLTATDGSISGTSNPFDVHAGNIKSLTVTAQPSVSAGVSFNATITGADWFGNPVSGHVTVVSSDGEPVSAVDLSNGQAVDPITLNIPGADTLTASSSGVTGAASLTVNPGDVVGFAVHGTSPVTAGDLVTVTVSPIDIAKNIVPGFSGTVTLTCSDSQAVSPTQITFGGANGNIGTATLFFTLTKAEQVTFTASWISPKPHAPTLTGVSNVITVNAMDPSGFLITGPSTVRAGDLVTVTVESVDIHGNPVGGAFNGTTLSCSDTSVIPDAAPAAVTFDSNGFAKLQFKLTKAEQVTFTASWSAPIPVLGATTNISNVITVNPGGALKFFVSAGATQLEATPFNVSITPEDTWNNVTSYSGPVTLTSNDGQQVVGGAGINAHGFGPLNVSVTLNDPGVVILTANATGQLLFGNSPSITVDAFTSNPPNWSGYVLAPGSQVNAVGGNWVQPTASGSGYVAIWVGIDGSGNNTVEQLGTQVQMVNGSPQYSVWYEMFPANPVFITTTSTGSPFQLQPGDQIGAEVRYVSGSGSTSIFVLQISDTPASGGPVEFFITQQTIVNAQQASAEWIVETPSIGQNPDGTPIYSTLANFGQTNFTGAWATVGTATGSLNSFTNVTAENMNTSLAQDYTSNPPVSAKTLGYNEPLSGVSSSSFTVTYGTSPPSNGVAGGGSGFGANSAPASVGTNMAGISGNSIGEALAFSAPAYSFDEKAGTITLTITRTSGTDGSAVIQYDVSAAAGLSAKYQAVPGADFTGAMDGTVTFSPGQTQATVVFGIPDNPLVGENKAFAVTLSSPTGGATVGSVMATTVTIVNDNLPVVPNATPHLATLQKAGIGFGTSDEHYQQFVLSAYAHYLRRAPSDAEVSYWVNLMKAYETDHTQGLKQEQIEAGFIDSEEYIGRFGSVGKAWIDGIYQDLLSRAPDANGEAYWEAQLKAGMDPNLVALGFTTSLERLQDRVTATYETLLGRAPDADGLKYWVNIFNSGGTTEDINSGFVGSVEYYNKADGAAGNAARWVREAYLDVLFRSPQVSEMTYWLSILNG